MRLLSLLTASLIPAATLAVFADEAFQVDYHHALLGIPKEDSTFVHQPIASSKASLLYTLTDQSLVGAVNPKDGSIVWRQQLHAANDSSPAVLRAGGENVIATAAGGQVAAWQASDGRLMWSHEYADDISVMDVRFLELKEDGSTGGTRDVLVLYRGSSSGVERRDAETGDVKWQFDDARYT
jgi:outer membrane protein assembly factor BamB